MRLIVGLTRVVVMELLLLVVSTPNAVVGLKGKVPKKNIFETKRIVNTVSIANVPGNFLLSIVLT